MVQEKAVGKGKVCICERKFTITDIFFAETVDFFTIMCYNKKHSLDSGVFPVLKWGFGLASTLII